MFRILLALHVLFAVFAIGPLVHAATTAGRGVRKGDAAATAASSRMLRMYSYGSVLVIIAGMALMSSTEPGEHDKAGAMSQLWVWLSLVLWAVAIALILAVAVPTLDKATAHITKEESVVALTGRVAAVGGVVGVTFAVIIFLMVYRPGQ